ncbi:MAG: hypothetical protein M3209_14570 [Acidobacteriota bacterium]|nr:hypothetical protein [Acidobacteriota bacterium]
MAVSARLLKRPSDRGLFLTAAIGFPLLVLIGYFKSYYFSTFFDVKPLANALVHAHGIVMTTWVVYFAAQIALIRSKNVRLHMTMGMAGVVLAALVVVVGLATAYDAHIVRAVAPPGIHPYGFMTLALFDLILFVTFFGGAIYYRKRPAQHKTLMLMTAINFLPAAFARIPVVPGKLMILWAFGVPSLIAISCLIWLTIKHRKINKIFALAVLLLVVSYPLRVFLMFSENWLKFVGLLVS